VGEPAGGGAWPRGGGRERAESTVDLAERQEERPKDAELLARLVRVDPELLSPIEHRSAEDSMALESVKARAVLVRARTMLLNHVRQWSRARVTYSGLLGGSVSGAGAGAPGRGHAAVLNPVLNEIQSSTLQVKKLDRQIADLQGRKYPETKILRQVPGVGPITALTYRLVIQSPARFDDPRQVGSYLGLRPRQDQSGTTDKQLRITKAGDPYLRSLLVGCAQYILGRHGPDSDLRRWGLTLAGEGQEREEAGRRGGGPEAVGADDGAMEIRPGLRVSSGESVRQKDAA